MNSALASDAPLLPLDPVYLLNTTPPERKEEFFLSKSEARKDRSSDEMLNWIMKEYKAGNLRPEIPDYAIDKHTLQGQMEGRTEDDFYAEGSKVYPEWEGRDKTYRERILKILESQKKQG